MRILLAALIMMTMSFSAFSSQKYLLTTAEVERYIVVSKALKPVFDELRSMEDEPSTVPTEAELKAFNSDNYGKHLQRVLSVDNVVNEANQKLKRAPEPIRNKVIESIKEHGYASTDVYFTHGYVITVAVANLRMQELIDESPIRDLILASEASSPQQLIPDATLASVKPYMARIEQLYDDPRDPDAGPSQQMP